MVKMNQPAEYLDQRPFSSKVIVQTHRRTHTHRQPIALFRPLKWCVKILLSAVWATGKSSSV